ncbi:MAG: hypothetical protein L3J35_12175 [Bacteroidales bacterium]|nr:hypothetical protein [Bacteroidales bacterium]
MVGEDAIRLLKLDVNNQKDESGFKYENLKILKEQLQNIIKIIDEDIKGFEEG